MDASKLSIASLAIPILGFLAIKVLNRIEQSLEKLTASIEGLTVKIAVICERVDNHEKRIESIERVRCHDGPNVR